MSTESTTSASPTYTVVWDIDGVLATQDCEEIPAVSFFNRKGLIIHAGTTQYIFPGVPEFFQMLAKEPDVRLAFFSSGAGVRNAALCPQLLERALGLASAPDDVKILSRSDLVTRGDDDDETYGLRQGNLIKDLSKVVADEKELDNTVLIEDDSSYVAAGQGPNLLKVSGSHPYDFRVMSSRLKRWGSDGYFFIPICVHQKAVERTKESPPSRIRNEVANGDLISISPLASGGYQIAFREKGSRECVVASISEDKNPKLCQSLSALKFKYDSYWLGEADLCNKIRALIQEAGGEIGKIKLYHSVNRIYYVAGILFSALDRARSESRSLTSVLTEIQYSPKGEDSYKPKFEERQEEDHWYHLGLAKLREANPDLEFTTPASYVEATQLPLTSEEQHIVEASLKKEQLPRNTPGSHMAYM